MKIKIGFTEIESGSLELVGRFWDTEEVDASMECVFQAPGEHYALLRCRKSDLWYLSCKTYQRMTSNCPSTQQAQYEDDKISGEPKVFTEHLMRIPRDLAELITVKDSLELHDTKPDHDKNAKASEAFRNLRESYDKFIAENPAFKLVSEDIKRDIDELVACCSVHANRASLAMAGRVMELLLKSYLRHCGRSIEDGWMVGKLLAEHDALGEYSDPALKNVWNIINNQRITGVHAKEKTRIPSDNEVFMVIYALSSAIERLGGRTVQVSI